MCYITHPPTHSSKVSSVYSPIFLSLATSALSSSSGPDYPKAAQYAGIYCALTFGSRFLKECQNLVYLDVKKVGRLSLPPTNRLVLFSPPPPPHSPTHPQTLILAFSFHVASCPQVAYAEICSTTFNHLLNLSLHWHLKKKIGVVIRAMDRGTDAADTVVTYLFLYLLPAIGECLAVCIVFLVHFQQWELSVLLFSSLLLYGFVTIRITLWRKKFRENANKKDNEIHERATDTLMNFECVKAFTNEEYEKGRFADAVRAYQNFSVTTSASLSLLNIIQQAIVQGCCVGTLILTAHRVSKGEMDVGDFVVRLSSYPPTHPPTHPPTLILTAHRVSKGEMDVGDFVLRLLFSLSLSTSLSIPPPPPLHPRRKERSSFLLSSYRIGRQCVYDECFPTPQFPRLCVYSGDQGTRGHAEPQPTPLRST